MTDIYGSEPRDHENEHDEILTHGSDLGEGHESPETPSEYEFNDPDSAVMAEHSDENVTQSLESRPPQRSPLPIAIALVGAVCLIGLGWWAFGSSAPSTPTNEFASAPVSALPIQAPPRTPSKSPDTNLPTTPKTASVAMQVVPDTPPAPLPMAPTPNLADQVAAQMKLDETGTKALSAIPAPVAAPAPIPAAPVNDERIESLTARVDTLQRALDQANQQLGQVSNMVAANASLAPSPTSPSNKDLQDRIDHLEQQLASSRLKQALPAAAPAEETADGTMTASADLPPKHVVKHKVAHKASAHKSVRKASKEEKIGWILRAASPGQAWVSTDPTSRDLRQIQLGDTLPGIGRVTAIQKQGDSWVVEGTKGIIQ